MTFEPIPSYVEHSWNLYVIDSYEKIRRVSTHYGSIVFTVEKIMGKGGVSNSPTGCGDVVCNGTKFKEEGQEGRPGRPGSLHDLWILRKVIISGSRMRPLWPKKKSHNRKGGTYSFEADEWDRRYFFLSI